MSMKTMRLLKLHKLYSPAGADDGGGGDSTVIDDADTGTDDGSGADNTDRGDEVDPAIDPKALAKVAEGDDPDDAADEGDGEAQPAGKKGSNHVPIGRFNEVNEKAKRLERENAELRTKAAAPPPPEKKKEPEPPKFDEDKAEREYAELLAEGDFDKAVLKRKEINKNIREEARAQAEANVNAVMDQRQTVQTLTQVAEQAVKDWPYIDTDEGAEVMDLIIAARHGFEAKGIPSPQALKKAVDLIAPKYAPAQQATPGKDSQAKPDGKDTRSQGANARGAADAAKQPPRLDGGAGNRSKGQTVDVEDLTDEQFDALSAAEKRRLRGDDS